MIRSEPIELTLTPDDEATSPIVRDIVAALCELAGVEPIDVAEINATLYPPATELPVPPMLHTNQSTLEDHLLELDQMGGE